MRLVFASFSTPDMQEQRNRLCDSALKVGFNDVIKFSPESYANTEFYKENSKILSQGRGAGYWLWKPYLILTALESLNIGDVLVYSDAGRKEYRSYELDKFPVNLISKARESKCNFLLGPVLHQHGPLSKWTKRDCFLIMDADLESVRRKPAIQATWSIWVKSNESVSFLKKWLKYCCDERCLTDCGNTLGVPNYSDFVDHRHDQSILSILAYKEDKSYLDFSNTFLFDVLGLRSKSSLSNQFMRKLDDCENILRYGWFFALIKAFFDIRRG